MRGLVQNLVMVSCIFLMLTAGLRTSLGQLIDVTRQFQLLPRCLLANFLAVPMLLYIWECRRSVCRPKWGSGSSRSS